MSHMTKIEAKVRNLESLRAACEHLGIQLIEGQQHATFWNGNQSKCAHAIRVPGSQHEIGVVDSGDGTYRLETDFYGPEGKRIEELCGKGLSGLRQEYSMEETRSQVRIQNYGQPMEVQGKAEGWRRLVIEVKA